MNNRNDYFIGKQKSVLWHCDGGCLNRDFTARKMCRHRIQIRSTEIRKGLKTDQRLYILEVIRKSLIGWKGIAARQPLPCLSLMEVQSQTLYVVFWELPEVILEHWNRNMSCTTGYGEESKGRRETRNKERKNKSPCETGKWSKFHAIH